MSERVAKRKAQHDNFHAPIRKALIAGSAALLLPHLPIPALSSRSGLPTPLLSCSLVPGLLSRPLMPGLLSCLLVPGLLSDPPVPGLSSYPVPILLSLHVPAPLSLSLSALSSRFVLGSALTYLTSSTLWIFKRALSDKLLGRWSISPSPVEPLCSFPTLGPLSEKTIANGLLIWP